MTFWTLSSSIPGALDPQLVGTVVYATLALLALLVADIVRRQLWPSTARFDTFERRSVGAITALFLLLGAYLLHGVLDLPAFPEATVRTFLFGPVALGIPAVVYAAAYGIEMRTVLPARDDWHVAAVALVVVALGSAAVWPVASLVAAIPDATVALGPLSAADVLLSLVLAPVISRGVRLGVELLHLDWRPLTAGVGVVLGLALVVVTAVGTGPVGPSRLAWGIGYAVVGAAACVGSERTRSLWVPVAVYAIFVFFTDIQVGSLLIGALF